MKTQPALLIVEDEPELRSITCELLGGLIPHVLIAENGEQALDFFGTHSIVAVLSDIKMPKMSGLQLLLKLREQKIDIPFVLLSGYADVENMAEARRLGAYDFVEKPFNIHRLLKVVQAAYEQGLLLDQTLRKRA